MSYLQNLYAPDPDPEMQVIEYERTPEQNAEFALSDMKTEPEQYLGTTVADAMSRIPGGEHAASSSASAPPPAPGTLQDTD